MPRSVIDGKDVFYLALTGAAGLLLFKLYGAAGYGAQNVSSFIDFLNPWSDLRATDAEAAQWAASSFAVRRDPKGRLFLIETATVNRGSGEAALATPIIARIVSQFVGGKFVRLPTPQPLPLNGWQSWPVVNLSQIK